MRRADRLFDIIQTLRTAAQPVTAAALAEQARGDGPHDLSRHRRACRRAACRSRAPPGLGYVLRRGFDLPPLMFTGEETDAIAVGVRLLRRLRDPKLQEAARKRARQAGRRRSAGDCNRSSSRRRFTFPRAARRRSPGRSRRVAQAIRETPQDRDRLCRRRRPPHAAGRSGRSRWPITSTSPLSARWCELSDEFRHFRVDRIRSARVLDERFPADSGRLFAEWLALGKDRPDAPH